MSSAHLTNQVLISFYKSGSLDSARHISVQSIRGGFQILSFQNQFPLIEGDQINFLPEMISHLSRDLSLDLSRDLDLRLDLLGDGDRERDRVFSLRAFSLSLILSLSFSLILSRSRRLCLSSVRRSRSVVSASSSSSYNNEQT